MNKPILSLCMPTNGVIEWVFPVLDSIYTQGCDDSDFEVIITDNGDNIEFKSRIYEYIKGKSNIVYVETDALLFLNEIESYKLASGKLIKFVNHRTKLVRGALQRLIDYAISHVDEKPITYFSNGVIDELEKKAYIFDEFDLFVKNLSYWSSWSTGMTIWKEDFDRLPKKDISEFNELFPHTNVLFNERHRNKYVIDNTKIFDEMPQGRKPKGTYDLFGAFGIEYPGIICDLLRDGDITKETFRYVLNKNLEFIAYLYFHYFIKKEYCSYDLTGLDRMYDVFYTKKDLIYAVLGKIFKKCMNKVL